MKRHKLLLAFMPIPFFLTSCLGPGISTTSISNGYETPCPEVFFDKTWQNVVDENQAYPDAPASVKISKKGNSTATVEVGDNGETISFPIDCNCTKLADENYVEVSFVVTKRMAKDVSDLFANAEGKRFYTFGKYHIVDNSTIELVGNELSIFGSESLRKSIPTINARNYLRQVSADSLTDKIMFRKK